MHTVASAQYVEYKEPTENAEPQPPRKINSKSFLISLVLKYNLDPTCVYSCKGVYSKKLNAVIVSLDESNLDLYNIIEPQG